MDREDLAAPDGATTTVRADARAAQRVAATSIGVGACALALKAASWWLTGSAAIYSDALESVVNVAASAVALAAVRYALRPADANHPYGHDKAEFFAAVLEGVLIVVAAFSILEHAWASWRRATPIENAASGIALVALATALNLAWALVLLRFGARQRSAALRADGRHLVGDVVLSFGVVLGVVATRLTGLHEIDPLVAALAALYVLRSGMLVISESVGGLMDMAPAEAIVRRVRAIVAENAEGALEAHDLRMRHAGRQTFLEFHLVVPGAMSVAAAHEICDRLELALRAQMDGMMVTIHVEPDGKAKHHGILVL